MRSAKVPDGMGIEPDGLPEWPEARAARLDHERLSGASRTLTESELVGPSKAPDCYDGDIQ